MLCAARLGMSRHLRRLATMARPDVPTLDPDSTCLGLHSALTSAAAANATTDVVSSDSPLNNINNNNNNNNNNNKNDSVVRGRLVESDGDLVGEDVSVYETGGDASLEMSAEELARLREAGAVLPWCSGRAGALEEWLAEGAVVGSGEKGAEWGEESWGEEDAASIEDVDAHTRYLAYSLNGAGVYDFGSFPYRPAPRGFKRRVSDHFTSIAGSDPSEAERESALRETAMHFRVSLAHVTAALDFYAEVQRLESLPSSDEGSSPLQLELAAALAADIGSQDPGARPPQWVADAAARPRRKLEYRDEDDLIARSDAILRARELAASGNGAESSAQRGSKSSLSSSSPAGSSPGSSPGSSLGSSSSSEVRRWDGWYRPESEGVVTEVPEANPGHPGSRTPWEVAPAAVVAPHPAYLQCAPPSVHARTEATSHAAILASGLRDPALGGYDADWEAEYAKYEADADAALAEFESGNASVLAAAGISASDSTEEKLEKILAHASAGGGGGGGGEAIDVVETLSAAVPESMRHVVRVAAGDDGAPVVSADLVPISFRKAFERDITGAVTGKLQARVDSKHIDTIIRTLRVPSAVPWYARGESLDEQVAAIDAYVARVAAAAEAGEFPDPDPRGVPDGALPRASDARDLREIPQIARESPAALLWHCVPAESADGRQKPYAPAPEGGFAWRGKPIRDAETRTARAVALRGPSRIKARLPKEPKTIHVFEKDTGESYEVLRS